MNKEAALIRRRDIAGLLSATVIGAAIWSLAAVAAGERELWDVPRFWNLFYPAALVASAILGAIFPVRAWRWGAVIFAMLAVVLIGTGLARGEDFSLLPLGLILIVVLALPAVAAGALAARLRR